MAVAGLIALGAGAVAVERSGDPPRAGIGRGARAVESKPLPVPGDVSEVPPPPPPPSVPQAPVATVAPAGPVALPLPGCPPPPRPPRRGPPPAPPWRPSVLVPEAELPEPLPPSPGAADLTPLAGKGMWLWKYRQTEAGDAAAIVERAVSTGLRQLWVRVGDSRDGFYAADVLAELVPRAHARGLKVIGWGFPYLWDPVADARWSADALGWRGPDGSVLDGFSPDIERASEGVALTARRARVYLGLVRQAAGSRLVVGTVYRPTDTLWSAYPYAALAPYLDAFAAMVYWGCTEPGQAAAQTIERLGSLRPVHLIGQGYDMAPEGGRAGPPTAEETTRFLDVARRGGARGASFWVWQSIGAEQWSALAAYPWPSQEGGGPPS
ncbi:MAG TPA: hypothetical protein VHG90_00010 [Acidimicrobiales bacterium]|nr:hypothetical protein [Acidimicrobiales bacterium]